MQTAVIPRPFLSICLPVTFWYYVQTKEDMIVPFSASSKKILLVSRASCCINWKSADCWAPIIGRPIIGQCLIGASLVASHVDLMTKNTNLDTVVQLRKCSYSASKTGNQSANEIIINSDMLFYTMMNPTQCRYKQHHDMCYAVPLKTC